MITGTSYLNYDTEVSVWQYAWEARSVLARTYSVARLHHFLPASFLHYTVLGWQTLRASHGNIISQRVHHWWGSLAS